MRYRRVRIPGYCREIIRKRNLSDGTQPLLTFPFPRRRCCERPQSSDNSFGDKTSETSNVQAGGSLKQPKKAIAKKNRFDDLFSAKLRKKILPFVRWRLVSFLPARLAPRIVFPL